MVAFEIAVIVITAGIGAAGSVRHLGKLKKLKLLIDDLVELLKRKRVKNKHSGDTNSRLESKNEISPPKVRRKISKDKLKYKPNKRGNAPIGEDNKPIELHHKDQSKGNKSPRDEMTMTEHRGKGNYSKNHPNTGQSPSTIDRIESSKQHKKHWENEWDSGRFDDLPKKDK